MENEKAKKSTKCVYCGHYEGYYTKGLHCFERTKQGFCEQHNKVVNNGDTCDCWETNRHRFYFRKRVISRALYEMLMDISAIRQIIQEEQEERKNL
ncbi:MAG TPA: hypothetical protein H9728_05980 [Candidatus Borkfalkia excrementavium]|uniref:Uncharacterized protein n=1 Tax=Candidatus Borkfalkia excrementavium TaxID=2838505 RepID=A0A9D1Z806_9FIRM|nr:hypothetical protein [Candidatus Borkfalkia excrementavium]